MSDDDFMKGRTDEEVLELIFNECEKNEFGLLAVSTLISYIECKTSPFKSDIKEDLLEHFDSDGTNPLINFSTYTALMTSWFKNLRCKDNNIKDKGDDVDTKISSKNIGLSAASSSLDMPLVNKFSETDMDELLSKMSHLEFYNKKLVNDKVDLINKINMTDDYISQLTEDNITLKEANKNQKITIDKLHLKLEELDYVKTKLIVLEEHCKNMEQATVFLENNNQKLNAEIHESSTKINLYEKETEDFVEENALLKDENNLLNERVTTCINNIELYKSLYLEKSCALDQCEKRITDLSLRNQLLKQKNDDLENRFEEANRNLRQLKAKHLLYTEQSTSIENRLDDAENKFDKLVCNEYYVNSQSLCQELKNTMLDITEQKFNNKINCFMETSSEKNFMCINETNKMVMCDIKAETGIHSDIGEELSLFSRSTKHGSLCNSNKMLANDFTIIVLCLCLFFFVGYSREDFIGLITLILKGLYQFELSFVTSPPV